MASVVRPRIENLTPNQIMVDPIVQRDLDHNWVKKLVDNWDDEKLGVIEVSQRSDGYYVSDGQHRLAALIEQGRGDERLAVHVVRSEGRAREAKRFVARNAEVRKPNSVDIYRVKLVAGDPTILEIDKVLKKHGLQVQLGQGPGYVAAVAALEQVHKTGGPDLLDRSLAVIEGAFQHDYAAYNGSIIRGVAHVLVEYGDQVDMDDLSKKLAGNTTPNRLVGKARAVAEAWRKSLPVAMAEVIINLYNIGKKSRRVRT